MTQVFQDWTEYDDWLVQNYNKVVVQMVFEDTDKKVTATWKEKESEE